jgi:hypothetical protein
MPAALVLERESNQWVLYFLSAEDQIEAAISLARSMQPLHTREITSASGQEEWTEDSTN